ncbi:MAG TPA: glycosyltransferase [Acidocella sp.]|nr:glycosyltransferase [Acidocella sp.]
MKRPPENVASAAAAWTNGQTAARLGVYQTALLWLERACRLAPNDPRIWLDLANAKIAMNSATQRREAIEILNKLTATHDHAPLELALLTAHQLQGDSAAAAAALAKLLQRHCVPDDPAFADAAELITKAVGGPGWCGLLGSGVLKISAAPGLKLIFLMDGNLANLPVSKAGYLAPPSGILSILAGGKELTGSPLNLRELQRVEGLVSVVDGVLVGWAHRPAASSTKPSLVITDAAGKTIDVVFGAAMTPDESSPFAQRWSYALLAEKLRGLTPPLHITGPDGSEIMGSPLDPALFQPLQPVPASFTGAAVKLLPERRPLAIIVPVYRNEAVTRACLAALQAAKPAGAEIIVIDDATPEPMLAAWLDDQAAKKTIRLITQPRNLGFPAAVNAGFEAAQGRDVLLLNSDTLVPPGAIEALANAAYAASDVGSATPFSNNATILNYPKHNAANPMPDLATASALQDAAGAANGADICEIPTAVGFCMYIRHDCLAATGGFRAELFGQGYGEENDWCLRARHRGYRHVAATGAYVAHEGGASFKAASRALNIRNARTLTRLYPGYDQLIAGYAKADPLAAARYRLDVQRFQQNRGAVSGAVLLISHNHGGGVARIIATEMQKIRNAGQRPLLLVPGAPDDLENTPFPWDAELTDHVPGDYPNLRFKYLADRDALLNLLRAESVSHVVLHHGLGHHAGIRELATDLGLPQDIVIHDYASFCPRINLLSQSSLGAPLRYCGEPNIGACVTCVELSGDETYEGLGPAALVERSAQEFAKARRIVAPSADAAIRISRHFPGVRPVVTPWENDAARVNLQPPGRGRRRIVIIGGIGPAKGYDLLIDCARDAVARQLELEFVIAGASADDETLLKTSRIFVTGAYTEGEATKVIQSLHADLAFLPSIWPETWCFALSEAWRAGLYSIAFDLGAQAARLKATRRGVLLPLGLPVPRINDILLNWQPHPGEAAAF